MSVSGQRQLEIEAARREQLRLDGVRSECTILVAACEKALGDVRDVAVQQLAGGELSSLSAEMASSKALIAARPDEARPALERVQVALQEAIARGEAKALSWGREQALLVARARTLAERATAVTGGRKGASGAEQVTMAARDALRSAEAGDLRGASDLIEQGDRLIETRRESELDERVRREVVKALLTTLNKIGFIVDPRSHQGVVVLDGRLPSGRRARFEVALDGRMEFDLDGYEGRACADDLDKVESTLRDEYGVKLGPKQVVWKNPDRLSRGAKDLPSDLKKRGG